MLGRTNTGGGGSDLNFKVIAVASESALPSTAAENTIAVITTAPITSYVFSSTAPASPAEGMVWFATGTASTVGFNAIKKNGLWVYPTGCQQYVSGAWVAKTAKTYQNGAWADWMALNLYTEGDQHTDITGGFSSSVSSGTGPEAFVATDTWIEVAASYQQTACVHPAKKIDVTQYSRLTAELSVRRSWDDATALNFGRIGLTKTAFAETTNISNWTPTATAWTASTVLTATTNRTATEPVFKAFALDISSVTGEYYINIGFNTGTNVNLCGIKGILLKRLQLLKT